MAGQLQTLQNYLDDLRRLLHDPLDRYWSASDKIVYVNKGMQNRDVETGCNRQLFTYTLTIGDDEYTMTDFGSGNIFDVVGINVIYGNLRVVMNSSSFTQLNVDARQYSPGLQYCPLQWARYGPNKVIFGPVPSQAYVIEVDACVYAPPLAALTDTDISPYPYSTPVPFYAAYWAKMNERQYDEADKFLEQAQKHTERANNSRVGTLASAYGNRGGMTWVR